MHDASRAGKRHNLQPREHDDREHVVTQVADDRRHVPSVLRQSVILVSIVNDGFGGDIHPSIRHIRHQRDGTSQKHGRREGGGSRWRIRAVIESVVQPPHAALAQRRVVCWCRHSRCVDCGGRTAHPHATRADSLTALATGEVALVAKHAGGATTSGVVIRRSRERARSRSQRRPAQLERCRSSSAA